MNAREVAHALGGDVSGRDRVLAPGPGHSPHDRSLSVLMTPQGMVVNSFANDDWRACRDYVSARLGIGWPASGTQRRPSPPTPRRTSSSTDQVGRIAAALRMWKATTALGSTLGERYFLEHRGLDVRRLDLGHVLRWHAEQLCIVALMTDAATSEPTGVHRTFINSGGAKLSRKMLGRKGVIRLSPDDAVTTGLGLVEGVEDGLAVILSGWSPVWAAADAGSVAKFQVLGGVEALTIFADADAAGMTAAERCASRWREADREARISPPPKVQHDVG